VLQCIAVRCSALQFVVASSTDHFGGRSQYVAVHCSALQCAAVCCSELQCVAVCCSFIHQSLWREKPVEHSALQCVSLRFSALHCVAARCSALQCVAVCCSFIYRSLWRENPVEHNIFVLPKKQTRAPLEPACPSNLALTPPGNLFLVNLAVSWEFSKVKNSQKSTLC